MNSSKIATRNEKIMKNIVPYMVLLYESVSSACMLIQIKNPLQTIILEDGQLID